MAGVMTDDAQQRGREAFERQEWGKAFEQLQAADHVQFLAPDDLVRLATAAYLNGNQAAAAVIWARAHHDFLTQGNIPAAARSAFWLGFTALLQGEQAPASGWLGRGSRLLEEWGDESVEPGYFLHAEAMRSAVAGDMTAALANFERATAIGAQFGDHDLVAMARQGHGRVLIRLGETVAGMAMLDEVMASLMSGELSPLIMGGVYCSVIEGCHDMFDLRRAREWTAALDRWCASQPERVPARGNCQIHRSQIMRFHGDWSEALEQAEQAQEWLSQPPPQAAIGGACYQVGEIHRLRGDFAAAENAYAEASRWGRDPQPGLAELRLAQGEVARARLAVCRALDGAKVTRVRAQLLSAAVGILIAAGDVERARTCANELGEIAGRLDVPYMHAVSLEATGAVLLAEGDAAAARQALSEAAAIWRELGAPHESARARVLLATASRRLGDEDTATMEFQAARHLFEQLEATPDLRRLDALTAVNGPDRVPVLTPREEEVIRLLAKGATNRLIAGELHISEKTAARHVSNIYTKLGLPNRAAATTWAHEHKLV